MVFFVLKAILTLVCLKMFVTLDFFTNIRKCNVLILGLLWCCVLCQTLVDCIGGAATKYERMFSTTDEY